MKPFETKYFLPFGDRVYAIGDIHGCLSNLIDLMKKINQDRIKDIGKYKRIVLVYLGDYVDRGPKSKEVLDFVLKDLHWVDQTVRLYGNHEELFFHYLNNRSPGCTIFLKNGGKNTLASYRGPIPKEHLDFLANPTYSFKLGEYLFTHAGLNPLRSVDNQTKDGFIWNFQRSDKDMGLYRVHGHMSSEEVELKDYRLNLDTGAWRRGTLSCGVIQDNTIRILQTKL